MVSRRNRQWADTRMVFQIASGAEVINDLRGSLVVPETYTVVRLVVDFVCTLETTQEQEGAQRIDFGIAVCALEAFNAGVVPNPTASNEYPRDGWLYVGTKLVSQAVPTGGTITAMWRETAVYKIDLRAARKIDRGVLYSVMENVSAEGAAMAVNVTGRIRALTLS